MRKSLLLALAICITLTLTTLAQQTSDVPVTSRISNSVTDSTGTAWPMQIRNDGQEAYQSIKNKNKYSVFSIIQGIGDWVLDTGVNVTNPTRHVLLDFSHPVEGSGPGSQGAPTPPFLSSLVQPRFLSQAARYGNSMLTMQSGETVNAPLLIGFDYDGERYRLHMTPDEDSIFPFPEANYVNITCTGTASPCKQWLIEPSGRCLNADCSERAGPVGRCLNADCSMRQNRVQLVRVELSRRGTTTTIHDLGDFYMAFSIKITNP